MVLRSTYVVIMLIMKKGSIHQGCRYVFGGLFTRLLRGIDAEEESLDYRPLLEMHLLDMAQTQAFDVSHGPILTLP